MHAAGEREEQEFACNSNVLRVYRTQPQPVWQHVSLRAVMQTFSSYSGNQ